VLRAGVILSTFSGPVIWVFALALVLGREAAAEVRRPVPPRFVVPTPLDPSVGVTGGCWSAVRVFRSLSAGPIPYWRGHLRYSPGDLDCFEYTDQVCSVLLLSTQEWIETRREVGPSVFPCPRGPVPPVCPRFSGP
jgi:hypothetical protein